MTDPDLAQFDEAYEADELVITVGELDAALERIRRRADGADHEPYAAGLGDGGEQFHREVLRRARTLE